MKFSLSSVINKLESKLDEFDAAVDSRYEEKQMIKLIRDAKVEWHSALNYFEQVSDPELIDYAIYRIEAARRKYMYLLRQARQNGIEDNDYINQMTGIN